MLSMLLELITGRDDLERVAGREDLSALRDCLRKRRVFVPQEPIRFLDAATFTQEELLELVEEESSALAEDFRPWVLEESGLRRLPAFSSQKRMQAFSTAVSNRLDRVFSLGCAEVLVFDVADKLDIDFIDLNLYSEKSWEIGLR